MTPITNNHLRKHALMLETDLSAQPVVVLPFEENGESVLQDEDMKDLQSSNYGFLQLQLQFQQLRRLDLLLQLHNTL